jgi:conjugative relaxase-like TrwC/TraI family protein
VTIEYWNITGIIAAGLMVGLVSIAALGQTMYHVRLAQDYYDPAKSGERPGEFVGRGAERLGLSGRVTPEAFRALMQGFHPLTGQKLVQNAGSATRDSAWDVVLSPKKSFSVPRGLTTDPDIRRELDAAFNWAVAPSIERIEGVTYTRKGKSSKLVPALPVIMAFVHECSRFPHDPQNHVHLVVLNIAVCEDGSTGALVSRPYFQHKMAWGALFRCDLAYALQQKFPGIKFRNTKTGVEIAEIPEELLRHFSTRRREIEEELAGMESETAAAKQFACLKTRDPKESVPPLAELSARWRDEARRLGFDPERIPAILTQGQSFQVDKAKVLDSAFSSAVESLAVRHSHFSRLDLLRFAADAATGRGVSGHDVIQHVEAQIASQRTIVSVGELRRQKRFSTPAIINEEEKLIGRATAMADGHSHAVNGATLTARASLSTFGTIRRWFALDGDPSLTADKQQAIKFLTSESGRLAILTTAVHTPKMDTLRRAAEFFTAAGYPVLAVGPTARHAKRLTDETGLPSVSLRQFLTLAETDRSPMHAAKHAAKQLIREALGRYIGLYPYQRTPLLDAKSVIIVDRSEQLSTQDMAALLDHCEHYGVKLILSGNADRIQSLERGAPFGALAKRLPKAELTTVVHPQERQDGENVERLRRGEAKEVLKDFAARGRLHIADTKQEAIEKLVADWDSHGGTRQPASHIIVVNTPAEARRINLLASERCRSQEPTAKCESIILPSGEKLFTGDRVICTKTSARYGVESGSLGTLTGVSRRLDLLRVELDSGRTVNLPLATYNRVTSGYAVMPWHAPQTAHAYLLLGGGNEHRQAALVKFSRATQSTRAYLDLANAGPDCQEIIRQLSVDRGKTLAAEIADQTLQTRQSQER